MFYTHYKGLNYFVHGIAKHSETLEEFVVYETRYDNPTSKLWIRPRAMFEEIKEFAGKVRPRFALKQWDIVERAVPTEQEFEEMMGLSDLVFGSSHPEKLKSELECSTHWLFLFIKDNAEKVIGFKYGKAKNSTEFFSANGAVHPNYQNLGIATALMNQQHAWATQKGFKTIETTTRNKYGSMLRLNLKHGFEIIGCETSGGEPKIQLRKRLL